MRRSYGSATGPMRQVTAMIAVVMLLHVLGFGALVLLVAPGNGSQALSVGLGFSAYMFGLRHAFDADHIAAIDNVTRKLAADGGRPRTVGFWFRPGAFGMCSFWLSSCSPRRRPQTVYWMTHRPSGTSWGMAGTLASGGFLYIIAVVNVIALVGIWRAFARRAAVASMRRSLRNSWTAVGCWPASCARSPAASPRRVRCSASGHCSGWDSTPRRRWRCWRWRGPKGRRRSLVRGAHPAGAVRGGYEPDGQC